MSGQCSKPSVRRRWSGRVGAERRERVLALDRRRPRGGGRRRRRARPRRRRSERTSAKPIPGWSSSAGMQRRVELVDPLQADPPRLARERDQAEAARGHDRELRAAAHRPRLALSLARALLAQHAPRRRLGVPAAHGADPAADHAPPSRPPRSARRRGSRATRPLRRPRPRRARPRTPRRRGPRGSSRSGRGTSRPGTGRGRRGRRGGTGAARPSAAASIRASWRSTRRSDGQRVDALDPGVVGDLVVGEEGRVADRPARVEVADHRGDLEVALDHRAPGAHERVGERRA